MLLKRGGEKGLRGWLNQLYVLTLNLKSIKKTLRERLLGSEARSKVLSDNEKPFISPTIQHFSVPLQNMFVIRQQMCLHMPGQRIILIHEIQYQFTKFVSKYLFVLLYF